MKKAAIISIGNELLSGVTIDTNLSYLSGRLLSVGIATVGSYTVGDDVDAIVRGLNLAGRDADVVLATGGLGPTDDDVTRQAFAKFLDVELKLDSGFLKKIEAFFAERNRAMAGKNQIQAYIPAGATALDNNLGTAPGIMARQEKKLYVAMPGVPAEMKQMFEESVLGQLRAVACEQAVVVRKLRCFGTGESNIAEMVGAIMHRGRNPQVNCTVQYGVITLHIVATAKEEKEATEMAEQDENRLRDILADLVYGTDEQTLAEVVGEKLAGQGKKIAVAESCTGGMVAKMLTDVPGASRYFTCGWVTYSNEAKTTELGVPEELIRKHGAVSEQIAAAMAMGAKSRARADCAIGITGIAGPAGGTVDKPVGLVYITVSSDNSCETRRFVFSHGRDFVRLRAAQTALNMLRLKL